MNVLLDVTSLMRRDLTGIGVYTQQLWRALGEIDGIRLRGAWRSSRFGKRELLAHHISGAIGPRIPLFSDLNIRGVDLYHGTDFRIPRFGRYQRVVTIHDIVVHEGTLVDARFAADGREKLRRTLVDRSPDAVIAISAFTRDHILEHYPHLDGRMHVAHLGVDAARFEHAGAQPQLPSGMGTFLLSVGSVERRKNLATTIEAFELLRRNHPDVALVIAGGGGHGTDAIDARIQASPAREAIHRLGFVDEAELVWLYRNASIFLFPSLYEGFGLPILESMAAGTAVITSDHGAMAEVAGGAALLVDPRSPAELGAAMARLLTDDALREMLVARGRDRAAAMTWQRCAQATVDVYRRIHGT